MKSWKIPTTRDVERAVGSLGQPAHIRYFFDRLKNPEWIEPLYQKGFFRNPPSPTEDKERGTVGFPLWPESRYLARMAAEAPAKVCDVILAVPETRNVRVQEDFVDAALAMPADIAERLVSQALKWIRLPYHLLLPEKLGDLITKLAEGGLVDPALQLTGALLEVVPDPRRRRSKKDDEFSLPPDASARFDPWHYGRILDRAVPVLLQRAPWQTFAVLCDLLDRAVRLSSTRRRGTDPEDYSYIWRPAVEGHAQNLRDHDVKMLLVSAVRDTAEAIVMSNPADVSEAVQRLEARRWRIFHRVALHLLTRFGDRARELVAARLTNPNLFDESWARHEYSVLLGNHFKHLDSADQQVILGWIETGPNVDVFRRSRMEWKGEEPSAEDIAKYRTAWQRNQLAIIRDDLPSMWRERYEAMIREVGEPEHPDFGSYRVSFVGPTSPKTVEELAKLSVSDLVKFLQGWRSGEGHFVPSPEGLGRAVTELVSGSSAKFADAAHLFRGVDATYVRSVVRGFEEAARKHQEFAWPRVIELAEWAVGEPREIPGRDRSQHDADPDWGWARKAIASLFSAGLQVNAVPHELRGRAWSIVAELTRDPDPAVKEDGEAHEPATRAINTVRGEAMHAVVQYALWVRRSLEALPDGSTKVERGFQEIPEAEAVLIERLRDPSLAIRSVYGQYFPWLVLLDPTWARAQVETIFPTDEANRLLWETAWGTYIIFCPPYDTAFEMLRSQYLLAATRLDAPFTVKPGTGDPYDSFAEHLMTFYWRGRLSATDDIWTTFWAHASSAVRRHALRFVGRSVANTAGSVPAEVLARIKALWDERLARAKRERGTDTAELQAFGWWFTSGKFDDAWALAQLRESVAITKAIDDDHDVVPQLERLAPRFPREAVECIAALVEGDREGWGVLMSREAISKILSAALASGIEDARRAAERLIHRLGEKGYFEFGGLLRGS